MTEQEHLERVKALSDSLDFLQVDYLEKNSRIKKELAKAIEDAKEDDVSLIKQANFVGKSRQALNKVLTDVFGVRHPDKSNNAKGGNG